MPATLRSSPAGTRTTRNSTKSPVPTPEKSSTPGKPRYCTSCKRPRKGHPREGCPFAEDTNQSDPASDSPTRSVAAALDALNLAGRDTDPDTEDAVERKPRKPFTRMPGTLLTPTSSFMYTEPSQSQSESCKDETPLASAPSFASSVPYLALSQLFDADATTKSRAHTPVEGGRPATATRPLARTLTRDERTAFTESLTRLAKATVYVLPTSDIAAIKDAAAARGLSARELKLDHADTLLVIGSGRAVDVLFYQVEAKMHSLVPPPNGGTVAKTLVVGAVGAVVAFGALAFS